MTIFFHPWDAIRISSRPHSHQKDVIRQLKLLDITAIPLTNNRLTSNTLLRRIHKRASRLQIISIRVHIPNRLRDAQKFHRAHRRARQHGREQHKIPRRDHHHLIFQGVDRLQKSMRAPPCPQNNNPLPCALDVVQVLDALAEFGGGWGSPGLFQAEVSVVEHRHGLLGKELNVRPLLG